MTNISLRFFALPLIALAVIASLPRPAPAECAAKTSAEAVASRGDTKATGHKACDVDSLRLAQVRISTVR